MTPQKIKKLLRMLGATVPEDQSRSGWVISDCPLGPWRHVGGKSSARVFGVRVESGDPQCNCFSCGFHGKLGDLIVEMSHKNKTQHHLNVKWGDALGMIEESELNDDLNLDGPDLEEVLFGEKPDLIEFPDWWIDAFPAWSQTNWSKAYLAERGVPPKIADFLDLRIDPAERRICFPVRDFSGRLVGLHGRAVDKQREPRYRMFTYAKKNNPIVWLGESWVDLTRPVVVVEGPFDLASVLRVYDNVVSPLFANPSFAKVKRMADALEMVTLFDHGVGGDTGREKIEKFLGKDHYLTHLKPPKGVKDPGDMTEAQLVELLSPHIKLTCHQLQKCGA